MPSKLVAWLYDPTRHKYLRAAQVGFVVLVLEAIGGGVMLAGAALDAMFSTVDRQSEIRSPDSSWVAVTHRVNHEGDDGYYYEIRLARSQHPTEQGSVVWDSYMERPVRVRWASSSTIEVEVAHDSDSLGTIHEGKSHGITARSFVSQDGHVVPFHASRP